MKKILLFILVFFLWTCSKDSKSPSEPEQPPIVVNLTSLTGQAQKGPFNNGTSINVAELTNALSPTGRNFSSSITDNTGRFAVGNVQLESPYVELRANGYYFNEVKNEISSGQLTLYALSDLTGKSSLNVNIITHLEKNRIATLMTGENAKTFAQAKLQAQEEILAIFDYSRANMPASELLDISQGGAANAKLLAISAILQGNLTVGEMSELLANISTDLASDGVLNDANLKNTIIDNTKNLNLSTIRTNLANRYQSLGISATIPDFETEINQFLKPPVAQNMSASTGEDTPINITLAASDPEGESLTYTILEVNNATVTLNGNVANYTPNANFNGTDTFTYKANDGTSDSNIATVTMTVSAEDDEPNTQNAAATTDEDVAVVLQLTAEEYDGDSYSFSLRSQPTNGSVSLDGANATYTPNQDYNGTDSFTFEATDTTGRMMNVGTATITINPVNDAPFAPDMTIDMVEDGTGQFIISSEVSDENFFRINATDIENDALTFKSISVNNATYVLVDNNNELAYYPNQDFYGQDTFQYTVSDGMEESNTGTITLNVSEVDDPPLVEDIQIDIDYNTTGNIFIIKGDYTEDVDGDPITFSIVNPPSNGSIFNDAGGGIPVGNSLKSGDILSSFYTIYNPNTDYSGEDSFTFKASDQKSEVEGTVYINVKPYSPQSTLELGFFDFLLSMSLTNDGGYIVTGNYNNEGKIVKLSQYGEHIEWITPINLALPSTNEFVWKCIELRNGNYAFIGEDTRQSKMFYGLLDSNGNQIFLNYGSSSGTENSQGINLTQLSNGNILTTSNEWDENWSNRKGVITIFSDNFESKIDFKSIADIDLRWYRSNENIIHSSPNEFFIVSNNSSGYRNFLTIGDINFQNLNTIELSFSKNVNITSIAQNGSNIAVCGYTIENNDLDFFLGEFDRNGNIILEKYYENFDGEQMATSIKIRNSEYMILGNHRDNLIIEILRIDSNGEIISSKKLKGKGEASVHLFLYEAYARFIATFHIGGNGYLIRDSIF